VRVKTMKRPAQSIRYLLCADRSLRRLSLRRISVRVRTAKQPRRSMRSKEAGRPKKSVRVPATVPAPAIVLVVIGVLATAGLIAARQPSHRTDVATVGPQQTVNAQPEKVAATVGSETKKVLAPMTPVTGVAIKAHPVDATMARKPVVEAAKSPATAANPPAAESAATAPDLESTSTADVEKSAQVTISGCLEFDDATFWLKDTDGVDAPTSRSWRSGFLRKRSAPIEVVGTFHALRLPTYVRQRVAATGTLIERKMQVRSLQRIADFCS
jgi:hypothetical protein